MKTALLTEIKVFGISIRYVLQKRHMKVLLELSKQELSWQSHGSGNIHLIRQQPLTEQ